MSLIERSLANLARVVEASGGTFRPGQADMVTAVAAAIESKGRVAVAAPTGTGKSLGALVPVVTAGKPALVVTSSIALQDQLEQIDLPAVAAVLNPSLNYLTVKGRGQSACPAKINSQGLLGDDRLIEWAADLTANRGRAGCPVPMSDTEWYESAAVSEDECPGRKGCEYANVCPSEMARDRLATADVAVVNMHIFTMLLDAEVLERFETIVVDECHDLLDAGCAAKAVTITAKRIERVADGLYRSVSSTHPAIDALKTIAGSWGQHVARIGAQGVVPLSGGANSDPDISRLVDSAVSALAVSLPRDGGAGVKMLATRVNRLRADLEAVRDTGSRACWVDRFGLHSSPLSLRAELAEQAWKGRAVVMCSATMPTSISRDTGLDVGVDADRVVYARCESPFDLDAAVMLYAAADLPDPSRQRPAFEDAATVRCVELVAASNGGALVLCTSLTAVARFTAALRAVGHDVLAQGDDNRAGLIAGFKTRRDSVLVGSRSFMQGVDVPGDALRLVVIDKILFPTPDDPLASARRDRIKENLVKAGRAANLDEAHWAAFASLDVPNAGTVMAQAAGRLIRSETDRGVIAVLDPRLVTKPYGAKIRAALPVKAKVDLVAVKARLKANAEVGAVLV